jgi:hypothetical protein
MKMPTPRKLTRLVNDELLLFNSLTLSGKRYGASFACTVNATPPTAQQMKLGVEIALNFSGAR